MPSRNPNQRDMRNEKKRLIDSELSEVTGGFVPIEPVTVKSNISTQPMQGSLGPVVVPRPPGTGDTKPVKKG